MPTSTSSRPPAAHIDPVKVIQLIQKDRNTSMAGPDKLTRKVEARELKQQVAEVRKLLEAVRG